MSLVKHFGALAEKQQLEDLLVEAPVNSESVLGPQSDNDPSRSWAARRSPRTVLAGWRFKRRNLVSVDAASPYLGQPCPNEQDDDTRFRVGDQLIICPVCGRAHHLDCWEWNDDHCYGGIAPCAGAGPRLRGGLSHSGPSGITGQDHPRAVTRMDRTVFPVVGIGATVLMIPDYKDIGDIGPPVAAPNKHCAAGLSRSLFPVP
ncbi:MAG: hypothetical protein IID39_09250 [Planctomycetes bacterium]|nr:hypothetical protein [Planctomycetota bacterium]